MIDSSLPTDNDLSANPFHVLGATTRDNLTKISELADERALLVDPDDCQKARAELANPRSRLSAEIAWLPGVSPRRALATVEAVGDEDSDFSELPALAMANVLSARLAFVANRENAILSSLFDLAGAVEAVDPESVLRDINEDRSVAGIPLVRDEETVLSELAARRRRFRDVTTRVLDNLPTKSLVRVVTELAAKSTSGGSIHAPALIEDIVDHYEAAAQPFLKGESENIERVLGQIRTQSSRGGVALDKSLESLKALIANWSLVSKPMQLVCRSKGIDHPASTSIAFEIRSLSLEMNNDRGKPEISAKLTELVKAEFHLLSVFSERAAEDESALTDILSNREQAKRSQEEFERSLSYSADVGAVFKERVEISAAGLRWKGRFIKLDAMDRMRWGGTRHSVNGIPTGTTYEIHVGAGASTIDISLRNQTTFSELIDRLWRGVGFRIHRSKLRQRR